jgi:hypothetical protein
VAVNEKWAASQRHHFPSHTMSLPYAGWQPTHNRYQLPEFFVVRILVATCRQTCRSCFRNSRERICVWPPAEDFVRRSHACQRLPCVSCRSRESPLRSFSIEAFLHSNDGFFPEATQEAGASAMASAEDTARAPSPVPSSRTVASSCSCIAVGLDNDDRQQQQQQQQAQGSPYGYQ